MKTEVRITGVADVNRVLRQIAPKEAQNLLRATLFEMAKQVAKEASNNAPVDDGDLKGSIKARRERGKKNVLMASVRVLRKAFYWRFLEYGQGPDGVEHAFFLKALQNIEPEIERIYLQTFAKKLVARLARLSKKAGS